MGTVHSSSKVRVRFAPSPTGWCHVGGARTALINYLFARHQKGHFILRVEDTDLKRGSDTYLKQQLQDLKWLGLQWDEGPNADTLEDTGAYGAYRQSQRLNIYRQYAEELIQSGQAYYCFMSEQEIETMKQQALEKKQAFRVVSPYRDMDLQTAKQKIKEGVKPTVRFKNSYTKKNYVIKDIVRGEVSFPSDMVGDFILLRSSGLPVYNFACAVDDHLMKITHVFRSEEHLANTLRQLMVFSAFNWTPPLFGHLSIILGEDRKKLSKRHGATSCEEFRKQGYLPSALLNFLALLGWNPKTTQEIFSMDELIEKFSLRGLNSASAVFDSQKLEWMNTQYFQKMDNIVLWNHLELVLQAENLQFPNSQEWKKQAMQALKGSFSTLPAIKDLLRPLAENFFHISNESDEVLKWPSTSAVLKEWCNILKEKSQQERLQKEDFTEACKLIKDKAKVKGKHLFMPLRVAIIGKPHGMELKEVIPLISRDVLVKRVLHCLER